MMVRSIFNRIGSALGGGTLLAISCLVAPLVLDVQPSFAQSTPAYSKESMQQALSAKHRYDLFGIHFDSDKATIQADSKTLLDDIAAALKNFPDWRLKIAGHTDATGDIEHNNTLSADRANAIKQALVDRGIDAKRLETFGAGERQPIATNDTSEGRALNRRVELVRLDVKPNILFIMGDDIGWMQPSIYHRGLMVGETPNIDRIGKEGAMFTDYYAEQSCTAGRNAFFTGMHPLRTGMIPPQLPGSPSYLQARHAGAREVPASTSATPPASSARTTWATTPTRCRRRTASRSSGATSITSTRCRA